MSPLSAKKSSKLSLNTKFLSGVENFEYAVRHTLKIENQISYVQYISKTVRDIKQIQKDLKQIQKVLNLGVSQLFTVKYVKNC